MNNDNFTEPFHLPPPRKLNKQVSDTIAQIVLEGLYPVRACESIGIDSHTYYNWYNAGMSLIDTGYILDEDNILNPQGVAVPDSNFKTAAYQYLHLVSGIKKAEADFLRDAIGRVRSYAKDSKQWAGEMTLLSRRFREYADQAPSTGDTVSHALDRLRELVAEIKKPELPHITVDVKQLD